MNFDFSSRNKIGCLPDSDPFGYYYTGKMSRTKGGYECQAWNIPDYIKCLFCIYQFLKNITSRSDNDVES